MNYTIIRDKTQQDLAQYFHACLFPPSISTLTEAIQQRNLLSQPGIENLNFSKLIGTTIAIELGHLDQVRKNLNSTTTDLKHEIIEPNESLAGTYVNLIIPTLHEKPYKQKYKIYSNQTGCFPYVSSRGNQYILVLYDQDYNAIFVELLKRRYGTQLAVAFKQCYDKLILKGR